jgi:uncharacterized protein
MKPSPEVLNTLKQFSGRAPILSLPGEVLFPHILLPLHVTDPSYCALVADAVHGGGLIALAVPRPGWEVQRDCEHTALFETVCLGQITAETQFPDGEFSFAIQGLSRARIVSEEPGTLPYRVGQLELLEEKYPSNGVLDRRLRQRELLFGLRNLFGKMDLDSILHHAIDADVPLGGLCDVIAYSLELDPCVALGILEEQNVDLRSDLVLECLHNLSTPVSLQPTGPSLDDCPVGYPPPFSRN